MASPIFSNNLRHVITGTQAGEKYALDVSLVTPSTTTPQFTDEPVSGANTYTSPIVPIVGKQIFGLDVRFVGTMVGVLTVECSNDGLVFQPLTFDPLLAQPSGSDLAYLVSIIEPPFGFLQVKYVNSSGAGTLTCILIAKGA